MFGQVIAWCLLLFLWGWFAWDFGMLAGDIRLRAAFLVALFVTTYARGRADEAKRAKTPETYDWPGIHAYWRDWQSRER